jgi:hypothetical protein
MEYDEEIAIESSDGSGGIGDEFVFQSRAEDKKHTLYGLPDHTEGQKIHVGTRKEFIGTFGGWNYPESVRDNASARKYEWLLVELRLGGRVNGTPKVIHLRSRVESMELDTDARPRYAPQPQNEEGLRLARIEEALGIRQPRRFRPTRIHAPRRSRSATPPQPPQPSIMELIEMMDKRRAQDREELIALMKLRETPPATQAPPNAAELVKEQLETFNAIAESTRRLMPQAGERTTFDRVIEVADRALEHAPKLLPWFIRAAQAQAAAKNGQPVPPMPEPVETQPEAAPAEEEADAPVTFDSVVTNIANDIINNNRPRDAVDEVAQLVAAQPELLPYIAGMIDAPADELIAQLSQATGQNLSVLATAPEYIEGLKKGVRKRIQLPALQGPMLIENNEQQSVS